MAREQNFRIIREFRAETQASVVKGTGISKQNISLWENGKGSPGDDFVKELATFFDLPASVFYEQSLTKQYLETNFSNKNGTSMEKPNDNKEFEEVRGDVYRKIVEGNTEYLLIPKSVLEEKYRIVALEQLARDERALINKDDHIKDLTEIIRSMATGTPIKLPEIKKAE